MPITLLIVDDSELIRSSLRRLFSSVAGIATIREAVILFEAIESVQIDPPTLVILDLNMPDSSDMRIIPQLKQSSPTLWITVLTFHADRSYCQYCLVVCADWFFDKATEIDFLLAIVSQHAALKPSIHSSSGT